MIYDLPHALDIANRWCACASHQDAELHTAVASLVAHTKRLRVTDLIDISISAQQQTADLISRLKS